MTTHLQSKLTARGYKPKKTRAHISTIKFSDRSDILTPKTKDQPNRPLVFATKYCDKITEIKEILNSNWDRIATNPHLKHIFPERPIIAYKSNPSLRNKLVRAKLPPIHTTHSNEEQTTTEVTNPNLPNTDPTEPETSSADCTHSDVSDKQGTGLNPIAGPDTYVPFFSGKEPPTFKQQRQFPFNLFQQKKAVKPCCKPNCKSCGMLAHHSNFVKSKVNGRCYRVNPLSKPMTCHSSRVVYLLQCKQCHKQYVGQTSRPLHVRMNQHVANIKRTSYTSLWWHFNKDHPVTNLKVIPLQQVDPELPTHVAEKRLQELETLWINRLSAIGMNLIRSDTQLRTQASRLPSV